MSIGGFRDLSKFKSWIFRIGYTTYLNQRRSVRPCVHIEEAHYVADDTSADSAFRYQALYEALNSLSEKERTSVLLYYMEGYAVKEIAEIQQTGVEAVKQHLSRGRARLRGLVSK